MKHKHIVSGIFLGISISIFSLLSVAQAAALPTAAPAPPPIQWQSCPDAPARDCGTLTVPLDYAAPGNGSVSLPVTRARATDQANRIGALFFNLGGPGVDANSTVKFGDLTRTFSSEIVSRFDIIGFDPRGTSQGQGIECFADAAQSRAYWEANHLPSTSAELTALLQLNSGMNQTCLTQNAPLVKHVDTASTVRDMEQLRRALAIDTFSYLGFSYGTFIGNRYAVLYPGHLRAMVLDAATDRGVSDLQSFSELTIASEQSWQHFKQWCQATSTCQLRGQNLDSIFQQLRAQARANPIPAPHNPYGNRPVNDWKLIVALQGVLAPGSVTYSWADKILSDARAGDASLASLIYDSGTQYNPATDSYGSAGTRRSITCSDTRWSEQLTSAAKVQTLINAMEVLSPRFGKANVAQVPMQCFQYPVAPVEAPPVALQVDPQSPTLVIGGTKDASTPYIWSVRTAARIKDSRLLTRNGDGHMSLGKSRCVEEAVNNVFIHRTLPVHGKVCETDPDLYPPVPPPILTSTTQRSAPEKLPRALDTLLLRR